MKIIRRDGCLYDANIARKISIDRSAQLLRHHIAVQLHARHLPLRMNARISSSRPVNNNLAPFSYADGSELQLNSFTNYEAPYMNTNDPEGA